ncbi:TrkH family potassium uptake protein [Zooshikella harenae]|uniref:Trk system potassium uptake protein n=1 Tax=Zooshikella harenae TaxID=2827238 RepID=A0ABS5ZEV2_9GAMM|nr:TrkH family potassium uptake protein [Zooshikella harenae]MBU2712529.1 TrkH family potassium uptake protein [Zooshikella harenae]
MSFAKPVIRIIGIVLLLLAALMLMPIVLLAGSQDWKVFVMCSAITAGCGILAIGVCRTPINRLNPNQLFLLTVFSWVVVSSFASLPLILVKQGLSVTDAIFETISGITTTGSTVISGLEHLPRDILLWRSILQWLGGIGIIGMAVAILPFLRVGGMRLFQTESSDWSDKALPQFREVAKTIVLLYLTLTVVCVLCYRLAGMDWFNALNHSMTTISTGGFSTSDQSMGQFATPIILWISTLFMACAALPFTILVRFWHSHDFRLLNDQQIKGLIISFAVPSVMLAIFLAQQTDTSFVQAITVTTFNVVSIITTTGYASTDYTLWGEFPIAVFFIITFIGGCSGSTSGGIKIFRFQISWCLVREQLRKLVHPYAIVSRRYNNRKLSDDIIASAVAFAFIFFLSLAVFTILLCLLGVDLLTSLTGVITALANVGPGLGDTIGPAGNFSSLPAGAKWLLAIAMILGRLELLSVLVVFSRDFWRR